MLDAKLVVVGGDAKSAEVSLKLPTVIGRGKEANLTVPHALVSRRHTEIFEKEGRLFVRDLGSLNGTFVDNLKIDGDSALEPNQLLTLGNITFRAVYSIQNESSASDSATEPETIRFDEVKTEEVLPKSENEVDFDETVSVEELNAVHGSQEQLLEPELVEPASPSSDETNPPEPDAVLETETDEVEESAADTDKSFKTGTEEGESISNIFSFEEEASPDQSVALSALDDLPPAQPAAVSFVGKVDFGDDVAAASQIDSIEIDLGDENQPKQTGGDTGLGSFLKKLPK